MSSVKAGSRGYVKRAEDNIPAEELRSEPAVLAHEPFFVRRARVTRPVGPTQCDEMKLVFANRGKTEIFHRRGGICLSPRKVVFLPAGQTYWGVPASFVETITVYVRPDFAKEQLRWLPHSATFFESLLSEPTPLNLDYTPRQSAELRAHLLALARELPLTDGDELRRLARLANVFALLRPLSNDSNRHGSPTEMLEATRYLEGNLSNRWTVEMLAKMVSLSPSQLTRLFVTHIGIPPSQYLREARAFRMHDLLSHRGLNVSTAAREVGWHDPSIATRGYRAVFGRPPSHLRRSALSSTEDHCNPISAESRESP